MIDEKVIFNHEVTKRRGFLKLKLLFEWEIKS